MIINFAAAFSLVFLSIFSVKASDLYSDHHHHHHHPVHHSRSPRDASQTSKIALGWLADWHTSGVDPSFGLNDVPWNKYNQLAYSFVTPEKDTCQLALSNESLLAEFVNQAHKHDVKALAAIGGWAGSMYFSHCVASKESRETFAKIVEDFITKYNLDGVNFDWEYPNQQGIGCNVISGNDAENYSAFLQELRKCLGKDIIISIATGITPFHGPSNTPITDVSLFEEALDYIAIMNYDIWGPWSNSVGPNAPLNDTCASDDKQLGSAVSAVKLWTGAGMPGDKIVLGVAAYGHSYKVSPENAFKAGSTKELAPYCAFDESAHPQGDSWDSAGPDACGTYEPFGGDWNMWGLINGGFLDNEGKCKDGIAYRFDSCSKTSYVYNEDTQIMVSYDSAESFSAKGHFIKNEGLAGFGMWEAGGDYNNILLDAIANAMN